VLLRPNQQLALDEVDAYRSAGGRAAVVTMPTGGGKSLYAVEECRRALSRNQKAMIYGNRKILVEKMFDDFASAGMDFGAQVAGYAQDALADIQVASIQTVSGRFERKQMDLFDADIVIVDEGHEETGRRGELVISEHKRRGATVVALTATPIGMAGLYDKLIVAGTNSELLRAGALVPAMTYAPDEPSFKAFKNKTKGILELDGECREKMLPVIFGRVIENRAVLNPDGKPGVLFADSVPSSLYFAEHFFANGIPAGHIDAQRIWINGETMEATPANRKRLRNASETGEVKIVCNRYVLRVGVDWPHIYHMMFGCTCGSVGPYIQMGGRGLRALNPVAAAEILARYGPKDFVIAQDHGGNFWRHDSLNADRDWNLSDTEKSIAGERAEQFRTKAKAEPIVCPFCFKVRNGGVKCPKCGKVCKGHKRMVIQTDGKLVPVYGDIYQPRRDAAPTPELHAAWKACVFRMRNTGRTFAQARGLFMKENNYVEPGPDFPCMPPDERGWYRRVDEIYPRKKKEPA
jgi:DNA repair protein RadD